MKSNHPNPARHRTITVHLHQPKHAATRLGDFRPVVPFVCFMLGYLMCLLTRA